MSQLTSVWEKLRRVFRFPAAARYVRHLNSEPGWPKNTLRAITMASSATTGFTGSVSTPSAAVFSASRNRRRRISPQAGRALSVLGHAIEYLADELVDRDGMCTSNNPQLEAVQLLMARNRQIYFECPAVPTWGERFRSLLNIPTV
jgi:hypothetical protein